MTTPEPLWRVHAGISAVSEQDEVKPRKIERLARVAAVKSVVLKLCDRR
jgi:hypothetical protein